VRVSDIAAAIAGASTVDHNTFRKELADLQEQAKQAEGDFCSGDLSASWQMSKDSNKDLLLRFEALYDH